MAASVDRKAPPPLLAAEGLSKSYGDNQVLTKVDLVVHDQEAIGLAGENGAGKSTLLNILSGVLKPDEGRVLLRGEELQLASYRDANHHGIFRVFQELALVPNIPVYENLFLTHEEHFRRFGILKRGAMARRASELLEEFGHGWIDPTRETSHYDFSVRQVIEIIKSFALAELLDTPTPVLLLDEPTAGLLHDEVEFFLEMVQKLKVRSGLVFVGHHLEEVLQISDRITVLKDGAVVGTAKADDLDEKALHHLMVGRVREEQFYKEDRQRAPADTHALELKGFSQAAEFDDVSLTVKAGEILGIAGVLGSGKSGLGRAIFGAADRVDGDVVIAGKELAHHGIANSMRARMGYVPPERAADGALLPLSVAWNISLARTSAATGMGAQFIDHRRERRDAVKYVEMLSIKTPGLDAPVHSLSGGNQQKVILARWLARGVDVLVLDNPTRGVDAGAKEDIYGIVRDLTDQGTAIVLISDDLPELIGLSTRVLIMKSGRVVEEIQTPQSDKPAEVDLVAHMV
jgi:ribose transport system ATP-binding protein